MLRWWCCCCLLLGMTALAWGDPPRADPLFRQAETAKAGESKGPSTFGLRIQTGRDDSSHSQNEFASNAVSLNKYDRLNAITLLLCASMSNGLKRGVRRKS